MLFALIGPAPCALANVQPLVGLDALIQRAVSNYPAVQGRLFDKQAALQSVEGAKWRFWPSLTTSNSTYQGQNVGTMTIQQPIWTGGALTAGLRLAEAGHQTASWSFEETREQVAEKVVAAYGDWVRAHGRLLAIRRTERAYQGFLDQIARREQEGLSARVEVDLVQSRLSQIGADVAAAQAGEEIALTQLRQLLGLDINAETLMLESMPEWTLSMKALQTMMRERSPSLRRAKAQAEAAQVQIDRARSVLSPQVSLAWQRNYGSSAASLAGSQAFIQVQFTPGAGLSSASEIDAAVGRYQAALSDVEAAERDLSTLAMNSVVQYQSLLANREQTVQSWVVARSILASYQRQFLGGRRPWLDVINAVREIDQIDRTLADLEGALITYAWRMRIYAYGIGLASAQ